MKGGPSPFELQRESSEPVPEEECTSTNQAADWVWVNKKIRRRYIEEEQKSNVSGSPTPSSTSSGGFSDAKWKNQLTKVEEKCVEMEDWERMLSESGQEQSILRLIMGDDVEDDHHQSMPMGGLNKMLISSSEFGVVDQGGSSYLLAGFDSQPQLDDEDVKPQCQSHQNPTTFFDVQTLQQQQQHQTLIKNHPPHPHPNRYNSGNTQSNFHKTPNPLLQLPLPIPIAPIDDDYHQQQGIIVDQLFKAAETIQSGNNPLLAQSILARLNHQLIISPPIAARNSSFKRAAFYFKEALQLLLHSILNNNIKPPMAITSPFTTLIFKIGAYKSFSEVSPLVHFTNFTSNQALLEVLEGFDRIHILDFDIRYGDQWASFMQELALRTTTTHRTPCLKITTFASPTTTNDHYFELTLTRDNLLHFAREMNIMFDFEILNIDVVSWSSFPFSGGVVSDNNNEAIAVNLPITTVSNYQIPLPLVLRFVKNLSPKIVVSIDRGCERMDLPFPNHLIHTLQSFSNLLESLDHVVTMNPDALQKIEQFLIQPTVEKIITGRFSFLERSLQHWRSQFVSSGFTPLSFSNFTESQALCVIKRIPIRGFHVERRQCALVLCWQHRELVSASAWRSSC